MKLKTLNQPSFNYSLASIAVLISIFAVPYYYVSQAHLEKRLQNIEPSRALEIGDGILLITVFFLSIYAIIYLAQIMYKRTAEIENEEQPKTTILWLVYVFFTLIGIIVLSSTKSNDNSDSASYIYLPFGKSVKINKS